MQGGIGVDRQLAKKIMGNVTYLYTQGVHQYFSNNVTAPGFDLADYTITGPAPALYNYQFQSGGFYRQNQLILSSSIALKNLTLSGNYTLNEAKATPRASTPFLPLQRIPASTTAAPASASVIGLLLVEQLHRASRFRHRRIARRAIRHAL